jgi:hypothetical protein
MPLKVKAQVQYSRAPSRGDNLPAVACAFVVVASTAGDFFPGPALGTGTCLPSGYSSPVVSLATLEKGVSLSVPALKKQTVFVLGLTSADACAGKTRPQDLFSKASQPDVYEIGRTQADLLVGSRVTVPNTYSVSANSLTVCGGTTGTFTLKTTRPVAHPNESITFYGSGGQPPYTYHLTSGAGLFDPSTGVYQVPGVNETVTVVATDSAGVAAAKTLNVVTAASPAPGFTGGPVQIGIGTSATTARVLKVQPDGKPLLLGLFQDSVLTGSGWPDATPMGPPIRALAPAGR